MYSDWKETVETGVDLFERIWGTVTGKPTVPTVVAQTAQKAADWTPWIVGGLLLYFLFFKKRR